MSITLTPDECCYWLRFIHGTRWVAVAIHKRTWGHIRYHAEGAQYAAKKALRKVRELRRSNDPSDALLIPQYQHELRRQLTIAALCHEALKSYAIETSRHVAEQARAL